MKNWLILYLLILPLLSSGQTEMVPYDHVLTDDELMELLDIQSNPELKHIQSIYNQGQKKEALEVLTSYFKEKFSERYFFNWKNFDSRFKTYNETYSDRKDYHLKMARSHMDLYPAYTSWKMPFKNRKGDEVSSYPYRHLTRQHKAGDIALMYHYNGDMNFLNYIPEQAKSLNDAFNKGLIESIEDGNGTYEAYRAGNRIFNWLFAHQILLASNNYSSDQQLEMIRCFLHTAAQISHYNQKYSQGNHQTRGMSALAMISILFPEIKGSENWRNHSLRILEEHLEREIYDDGFQFERSVHYHMSDIENYFLPYQLAEINHIELNPVWKNRLFGLFNVLMEISFPDKNAPVLQDDTDQPWAEFNKIDETMALGAVLFANTEFNYFASSKVASEHYWFLNQHQLEILGDLGREVPQTGSCSLPETAYFIMREGWDSDDLFMIISAGLSEEKPDHQHGDMLGLQAYAYGKVLLPNYQVRYYLTDLNEFKNSWTKSVLLIDSIPQGREWKGNTGGSGFGLWKYLPKPEVISWYSDNKIDFFAGTHNAYDDIQVKAYRSVFFLKGGFWIVKDHFVSENGYHKAQQIWQGHYDIEEDNRFVRSVFSDGGGLEIIQLGNPAGKIYKNSVRAKGRVVFEKEFSEKDDFITLLHPFEDFDDRIISADLSDQNLNSWNFTKTKNVSDFLESDAGQVIYKKDCYLLIGLTKLDIMGFNILNQSLETDLWLTRDKNEIKITNCGINNLRLLNQNKDFELIPGHSIIVKLDSINKLIEKIVIND